MELITGDSDSEIGEKLGWGAVSKREEEGYLERKFEVVIQVISTGLRQPYLSSDRGRVWRG